MEWQGKKGHSNLMVTYFVLDTTVGSYLCCPISFSYQSRSKCGYPLAEMRSQAQSRSVTYSRSLGQLVELSYRIKPVWFWSWAHSLARTQQFSRIKGGMRKWKPPGGLDVFYQGSKEFRLLVERTFPKLILAFSSPLCSGLEIRLVSMLDYACATVS